MKRSINQQCNEFDIAQNNKNISSKLNGFLSTQLYDKNNNNNNNNNEDEQKKKFHKNHFNLNSKHNNANANVHSAIKMNGYKSYGSENFQSEVFISDYEHESEDLDDEIFVDNNESKLKIHNDNQSDGQQNFRKDFKNIIFLMFLYFLQGVPLGLTGSLPFILSSRKVSYSNQGTFSFAFWPFSLKLLWAPLVDSLFVKSIGRRKSWLVPCQYFIGFFMIFFSSSVHYLIESDEHKANSGNDLNSDIYYLTGIFFIITFFTATQDIVVDGWGLTMLSKENISWSSTCNNTGQTAGWFVGNIIFLVLQSSEFSNKYVRPIFGLVSQNHGLIPIDKFMQFFGIVFIISTTLIFLFKKERTSEHQNALEDKLNFLKTYQLVWRILNISCIKKLVLIIFTSKIAFAVNNMVYLKLIEKGVHKESLGLLAVPLTPLEILLPIIASKYTNGPKPLDYYIKAYPFRIIASAIMVFWVFLTPFFKDSNNQYPLYYFILCILVNALHSSVYTIQSVTQTAFFTRICDKTVGGTYMTLLNTISNIGTNWPATVSLYLVDFFTTKGCFYDISSKIGKRWVNNSSNHEKQEPINFITLLNKIEENVCSNEGEIEECLYMGGSCITLVDAYYFLAIACFLFGIIWIFNFQKSLKALQSLPKSTWKIKY